jgi:hypothetical protein
MGIRAERVQYLEMARGLGWVDRERIEQRGEGVEGVKTGFRLMEMWRVLGYVG